MFKLIRLSFLRSLERFFDQWISVCTEPSVFVRERIHLGDTTNLLRAVNFFVFALSGAFLAETAILLMFGIGDLSEPYFWLFTVLSAIPFVLVTYVCVWFVARLSFKDVLHLSLYPVGAGVFTGAVFGLVAAAVIGLAVATGYIPDVRYNLAEYGNKDHVDAVYTQVLMNCLKQESLALTVVAAGLQEALGNLKPPIDGLSYVRPFITILFLVVAARMFMAAVDRRKWATFATVLMAAVITIGIELLALREVFQGAFARSECKYEMVERGRHSMGESSLKILAAILHRYAQRHNDHILENKIYSDGRKIIVDYQFKIPMHDMERFRIFRDGAHADWKRGYCEGAYYREAGASMTHVFYAVDGTRLDSFTIDQADCPKK